MNIGRLFLKLRVCLPRLRKYSLDSKRLKHQESETDGTQSTSDEFSLLSYERYELTAADFSSDYDTKLTIIPIISLTYLLLLGGYLKVVSTSHSTPEQHHEVWAWSDTPFWSSPIITHPLKVPAAHAATPLATAGRSSKVKGQRSTVNGRRSNSKVKVKVVSK